MKVIIKHEIAGRMRLRFSEKRLSFKEADTLQYYLENTPGVTKAVVYERTADAVIRYTCDRKDILERIKCYSPKRVDVPESYFEASGRDLNAKD